MVAAVTVMLKRVGFPVLHHGTSLKTARSWRGL